jgi:hypothetical protein
MPTAALMFIALMAIYVATTGRAKKVLEALGAASSGTSGGASPVPDVDGQGSPGGTEETNTDLLRNNAQVYNARLTNPGAMTGRDAPFLSTNYGFSSNVNDFTGWSG